MNVYNEQAVSSECDWLVSLNIGQAAINPTAPPHISGEIHDISCRT